MDESENPLRLSADVNERRDMPRCAVEAPATLMILSRGTMMVGQLKELSLSGCRLLLPKTLTNTSSATVECTFRVRGVAFRLGGIIEWAEDNFAGIEFSTMSSRTRDDLVEVLCEVELENNSRQQEPEVSQPPVPGIEEPAIDAILKEAAARSSIQPRTDVRSWNPFAITAHASAERKPPVIAPKPPASAPQLRPLPPASAQPATVVARPTPPPATSPVPAKKVESGFAPSAAGALSAAQPQPSQPNQSTPADSSAPAPASGRDRRATRRAGVDTSAIIDLVKVGSRIPGQIVDLSVGGCRIKTVDKFPVGIYTRIETEFQLHGLPFRLGGVIQAIHNNTTVGIRFLDMSDRKKAQVAELVNEILDANGG